MWHRVEWVAVFFGCIAASFSRVVLAFFVPQGHALLATAVVAVVVGAVVARRRRLLHGLLALAAYVVGIAVVLALFLLVLWVMGRLFPLGLLR